MADLGTIGLGLFTNIARTGITGAEPVLQVIESASDASYAYTLDNTSNAAVGRFEINAFPGDLGNVDTLFVRLRYHWQTGTQVNTWTNLQARVFKSDGVTPLTDLVTVASNITVTTPSFGQTTVGFAGVDTAATAADWAGAVLDITWNVVKNMGGDTLEKRVVAAELTGTYTVGAAVTNASGTLTGIEAALEIDNVTGTVGAGVTNASATLTGIEATTELGQVVTIAFVAGLLGLGIAAEIGSVTGAVGTGTVSASASLTGLEIVIEQAETRTLAFDAGLLGLGIAAEIGVVTGDISGDAVGALTGQEITIEQVVFDGLDEIADIEGVELLSTAGLLAGSVSDVSGASGALTGLETGLELGALTGAVVDVSGASGALSGLETGLELGALTGAVVDVSGASGALSGIELAVEPGLLSGEVAGAAVSTLTGQQLSVEIGALTGVVQSPPTLHGGLYLSILAPTESIALLQTPTIKLLEVAMSQTIWLGRDNTIDMALMDKSVPQEASAVTSWSFHLYPQAGGASLNFTSALNPTVFDTSASMLVGSQTVSILRLKLGLQVIGAGEYTARVVGYDAGSVNGFLWGEFAVTAKAS